MYTVAKPDCSLSKTTIDQSKFDTSIFQHSSRRPITATFHFQLIVSVTPRFCFIMVVMMIFFLDDSLAS